MGVVDRARKALRVFQQKPIPAPNLREISTSRSGLFDMWPSMQFNPDDDLISVQGLQVYERMRTDDQVKAALQLKKGSVLSTGWEIVSATDEQIDRDARDYVEWNFTHLDTLYGSFDDIVFNFMTALDFGFSLSEILWMVLKEGPFEGHFGLRTIKTRKPHNFAFDVDRHDNLKPDGIVQHTDMRMPPEKFLIYSFQKEFGNFYGLSDLRSAYRHWWIKDNILKWWAMYMERFGVPIAIGTYPADHPVFADIDAFRTVLVNLQANTSITKPDTFGLELVEAKGTGSSVFQKALNEANLGIARSLLVPSLLGVSAQQDTGSFSQAKKHFDIFLLVVEDIRRDLKEDIIQNQLISRMIALNFDVDDDPRFQWRPFTEENRMALFELWLKAVEKKIVKPIPEDEIHVRSVTNFPERAISDAEMLAAKEKLEKPPAPPPPAISPPPPPPTPITPAAVVEPTVDEKEVSDDETGTEEFQRRTARDFQKVTNMLDGLEDETKGRMTEIIGRSRDQLLATIKRIQDRGDLTGQFINDLDLKYKGDLNRVVGEFLSESYKAGQREGKDMLPRTLQKKPLPPGIAPNKALAFFDQKKFFITGTIKEQILTPVKATLFNALKTGETSSETLAKLEAAFAPYMGDPVVAELAQPFRLETILRTNSTEALNKGIRDEVAPEIQSGDVIAFQYESIIDSRSTDLCSKILDGQFFRPDGAEVEEFSPPNHFNCRALFSPVPRDEAPITFITQSRLGRARQEKEKIAPKGF